MSPLYPLKLPASFREKIWGKRDLSPWFPSAGPRSSPIGEVWYSFEENRVANGPFAGETLGDLIDKFGERLMGPGYRPSALRRRSASQEPTPADAATRAYFPILTKLLFTNDRLSIQVHPDDEYALAHEGGPGKTEAWYVVAAEPGARIALGTKEGLAPDQLRRLAESGEIVEHLNWIEARPGDGFFVPPGTLHALGPGLVICEVQQNSDLTYRLYDYGRPGADGKHRPLHLDRAAEVVRPEIRPEAASPVVITEPETNGKRELLAACRYFAFEKISWEEPGRYIASGNSAELLIFLEGRGRIGDDGPHDRSISPWREAYAPGDAYLAPYESRSFDLYPECGTTAMRAYVPDVDRLTKQLRASGATTEQLRALVE